MIRFARTTCFLGSIAAAAAGAQEHRHPEGRPVEKLGTVHFQTSCNAAAAPRFDRGVALLHSFEFGAAIRAFNETLVADSGCAMAYWGISMSLWSNPVAPGAKPFAALDAGRRAADAARMRASAATARERAYIAAVATLFADYEQVDQPARVSAYERAMAQLAAGYPADTEARIFHAIALVASASPGDKSYAKQLEAGRTLETLWAAMPDHPGLAHYIIHAYDYPPLADRARSAAQLYGEIAPSTAHALHMPSHTFTRVGRWDASIATNLRSFDVAMHDGAIAEALHALDYAAYGYLQRRQDSAAKVILDRLPTLAERFDPDAVTGAAPGSAGVFALAAIPARYALERRDWAQAARLPFATTRYPWTEAMTHFARALGAAHTGMLDSARASIDSLGAIERRLRERNETYWAEQVAIQWLEASAWLEHFSGRDDVALARMTLAATRERATEKSAVTPGPLAPAGELLGDLLMELHRPAQALEAYRATLATEPNRFRTLDGARRAARAAGDREAEAIFAGLLATVTGR